jgi:two-component system NtrC family sensor kinase
LHQLLGARDTTLIALLKNISLRAKITISFVLIVICGTAVSTFIGSRIITNAMINEALKQVRHGLEAVRIIYTSKLENVRAAVIGVAGAEKLTAAMGETGRKHLPQLLTELRKKNGLDFLTFIDTKNGWIVRGSDMGVKPYIPGSLPLADFLSVATGGQVATGSEVLSRQELQEENPALDEKAHFKIIPIPMAEPDSRTEISSGLVLVAATPFSTDSGSTGIIYGGVLVNRNHDMVDQINRLIFGQEQSGGHDIGSVSIFLQDVRIATTVMLQPNQRAEGTRVSADVAHAVLGRGERWYGRAYVVNEWRLTAYEPIRNHSGKIIGILYTGLQEAPFLAVRTAMMLPFLAVAAVGVLVVLGLTYLITRSMIHPLEEMVVASNRIAAGDLDHTVNVSSADEIGYLAGSFNKMLASLKNMKLELEEWGRTLEEKVKARTEELVTVQNQMAQSEKLASLGRMAAGVAHEINNPLGGILAFSTLALEDCEEGHPLHHNLDIIIKQTLRCRETVKGLLDFARQSSSQATLTEINSIIDKTLLLLENQAIFHDIRIVEKFNGSLPQVLIDPGQLQQVIVNIALNAVDAMEEVGEFTVETDVDLRTQDVLMRFCDTGKGIPNDILPLIFEPFFTTKKVGKGTGLGLAIVHGIVTRAGGKVEVASSPRGTTFTIRLPIASEGAKNASPSQDAQHGQG